MKKDNEDHFSYRIKFEQTDETVREFIHEMSKTISINWAIFEDAVDELIEKEVQKNGNNLGLLELHPGESKEPAGDPCESLVIKILNFGYSIGHAKSNSLSDKVNFNFEGFFTDLSTYISFDKISNEKPTYNGPDITSSSILATTFNIKETMKKLASDARRYYGSNPNGKLLILLGKVYQYGYGIGHDKGYNEMMEKWQNRSKLGLFTIGDMTK